MVADDPDWRHVLGVYHRRRFQRVSPALASSFLLTLSALLTWVNSSFIDALMTMPLGWLLCAVQILSARNDMFSNVFEIAIATIISFIAAALASTRVFCYTALVSGGVVLILPGYIVLTGALELASRNITAGAVRIGYSEFPLASWPLVARQDRKGDC